MKPYKIHITGTGHSGDENPNAIEKRVQQLVNALTGNGHQLTGATLIIEGQEIPLTSGLTGQALPSFVLPKQAPPPVSSDAEVPISLRTVLDAVNDGRKEAQAFFNADKKEGKPEPKKKKGGAPEIASPSGTPLPQPDDQPANAATPQDGETGASAQADPEEKPAAEPQPPEGGDVQA